LEIYNSLIMAAIIVDISNAPGASIIKRKIEVIQYTKHYTDFVYTVPYTIKHYDENDQPLSYIQNYHNILIADNIKRVWLSPQGQMFEEETPGCTEMGMFDFLQLLQKSMTDQAIITAQILRLDSQQSFDTYVLG